MKLIFLMPCLLLACLPGFVARADEYAACQKSLTEWNRCDQDSDCGIVPDVCGSMTAATNAAHLQEATDCNLKLRAEIRCASIDKPQDIGAMQAVCRAGVCQAESAAK